jgi:multisubunit Na+/H+ antiporter MnhC subunit
LSPSTWLEVLVVGDIVIHLGLTATVLFVVHRATRNRP